MKRIISLTLAVLLIAALFVGCGSTPAGVYTLKTINGSSVKEYYTAAAEAEGIDIDKLLELIDIDLEHPENMMQIELKDDGSVAFKSNFGDAKEGTGTWKQEGDKLILTMDGEDQTIDYKNGEMTLELGNAEKPMTVVLGK